MYDVITFGSATKDYFLTLKEGTYNIKKNRDSITGEDLVFPLGSKIEIKKLFGFTGGGGTNSAITFSKQGLKTAYVGICGEAPSTYIKFAKFLMDEGIESMSLNPNVVIKTIMQLAEIKKD